MRKFTKVSVGEEAWVMELKELSKRLCILSIGMDLEGEKELAALVTKAEGLVDSIIDILKEEGGI